MLDEFFPMLPTHRNSFCNYINLFYTTPLDIAKENVYDFDLVANGVLTLEEMKEYGEDAVDLTLLTREPVNDTEKVRKVILQKVQGFCDAYEKRLEAIGGIGFFLGGIGPDGHIAFNQEGASHSSPTRLVNFNYPTAAAAASDLGGIEIARGKAAMTIGLATISFNKAAKVIIMAAGEGKAGVVRAGVEDEAHESRPSSILHSLPNARFYVTHGAASKLSQRNEENISKISADSLDWALVHLSGNTTSDRQCMIVPPADYLLVESCVFATSLKVKKAVHLLTVRDMTSLPEFKNVPQWLQGNELAFRTICSCASRRLKEKIEGGIAESTFKEKRVLHTAPHHDDIMLSYHGAMHDMLGRQPAGTVLPPGKSNVPPPTSYLRPRSGSLTTYLGNTLGEKHNKNLNHFAYLTSGFHSVNDDFLWSKVDAVLGLIDVTGTKLPFIDHAVTAGQLTREYDDIMIEFREAFFEKDFATQEHIENIIFTRKVAEVWQIGLTQSYSAIIVQLKAKVEWIRNDYLSHHQRGDAVPRDMQLLKGCMRESEVDRVWALSSMPMNRVHHMRSK